MIVSSEGIVLKTIRHGDNSAIVRIYTRLAGIQSFILKGINRPKDKRKALLGALSMVEVSFRMKHSHPGLTQLKEIRLLHNLSTIPFFPGKTAQSLFIAEILNKVIREEEKNEALFSFLEKSIQFLDATRDELPDFHLKFLIELSSLLGFYPNDESGESAPWFNLAEGQFSYVARPPHLDLESTVFMRSLIHLSYDQLGLMTLNRQSRNKLLEYLILYYQLHLPSFGELKGPTVLSQLFD